MIKNNRPYTNENGWEDKTLITEKDEATQSEVRNWIKENIVRRKAVNRAYDSYGLKHVLERDTGVYLTNNEFKDAMYQEGFYPVDENRLNWTYRFVLKRDIKKRYKSSFYRFAKGYRLDRGPKGDFARDMLMDDDFPDTSDKEAIYNYLTSVGACFGAEEAFEDLWAEYEIA